MPNFKHRLRDAVNQYREHRWMARHGYDTAYDAYHYRCQDDWDRSCGIPTREPTELGYRLLAHRDTVVWLATLACYVLTGRPGWQQGEPDPERTYYGENH